MMYSPLLVTLQHILSFTLSTFISTSQRSDSLVKNDIVNELVQSYKTLIEMILLPQPNAQYKDKPEILFLRLDEQISQLLKIVDVCPKKKLIMSKLKEAHRSYDSCKNKHILEVIPEDLHEICFIQVAKKIQEASIIFKSYISYFRNSSLPSEVLFADKLNIMCCYIVRFYHIYGRRLLQYIISGFYDNIFQKEKNILDRRQMLTPQYYQHCIGENTNKLGLLLIIEIMFETIIQTMDGLSNALSTRDIFRIHDISFKTKQELRPDFNIVGSPDDFQYGLEKKVINNDISHDLIDQIEFCLYKYSEQQKYPARFSIVLFFNFLIFNLTDNVLKNRQNGLRDISRTSMIQRNATKIKRLENIVAITNYDLSKETNLFRGKLIKIRLKDDEVLAEDDQANTALKKQPLSPDLTNIIVHFKDVSLQLANWIKIAKREIRIENKVYEILIKAIQATFKEGKLESYSGYMYGQMASTDALIYFLNYAIKNYIRKITVMRSNNGISPSQDIPTSKFTNPNCPQKF